ncbi:unnamed protein product [Hymenolepis diminuta]|nr:unnamed protein product [Hymenolepis diminuta]
MREEIGNLQERLAAANAEKVGAADMELVHLKAKIHELEGRLELETSAKQRLQSTVERLKSQIDQIGSERERLLSIVQSEREKARQLTRNLREAVEGREHAERRLEEHKRSGSTSNDAVSAYIQEQQRLQQELSHLLLRCKEEELKSVIQRSRQINNADDYDDDDYNEEDMNSETGGEGVYTSEVDEGEAYTMKIPFNGSAETDGRALGSTN